MNKPATEKRPKAPKQIQIATVLAALLLRGGRERISLAELRELDGKHLDFRVRSDDRGVVVEAIVLDRAPPNGAPLDLITRT